MTYSGKPDGVFKLTTDEHWVLCPYDLSHLLTNLRIAMHVGRCRKNYISKKRSKDEPVFYRECRYNYLHSFPEPEIEWHEQRCPSKEDHVRHVTYVAPRLPKPKEAEAAVEPAKKFPPEEDWGLEALHNRKEPFDPSIKLQQERPCVPKPLLTRSERREFKEFNRRLKNELYPETAEEPFKKIHFSIPPPDDERFGGGRRNTQLRF